MPYTPPSHRSPASSAPSSPDVSRRSSFHGTGVSTGAGGAGAVSRPQLPRSASYLTKNRRTQPAAAEAGRLSSSHGVANVSTPDITPPGTSDDLKGMAHAASVAAAAVHLNVGPVRQSPPPVTDGRTMPMGAIISPPDSQTSSEDEGASREPARGREIENLKELQDAISAIPQHRTSSPDRITEPGDLLVLPSQITHLAESQSKNPANRRISHARSHTEPSIFVSKSVDASPTPSEADSEIDDPPQKPVMVRKKSGELVRPALRPAANRRPSSMPGTPTFSKAVHFDSHLEHVRHFLQVDRPLAVSAGSSPNDNYESDTEYPFNNSGAQSGRRSPPHEWELVIHNFPAETPLRRGMPIRVERLWMSPDQKCLIGSCSVANLAFQKSIVCRFTFDYWKTVSEITADFSHEIRPRDAAEEGHDRFQFTIKLSDLANLESKTLYFCVRYNVNGTEYWDNNNGLNFQVDFRKKMLPQNGKKNFQGASSRPANSLPRSNRRPNPNTAPRPKSMPVGVLDEFGTDHSMWDDGPLHEFLGESGPIRLKRSSKSTTSLPSDNLTNRLSAPSGLAFANRYDFGASLSAAKQASTGSPRSGDGLYMKPHKKASFGPPLQTGPPPAAPSKVVGPGPALAMPTHMPGPASPASASIATASYEEIVNKYCFFNGSKQNSPQLTDGALRTGRYDGGVDYSLHSSDSSANGSPEMKEHKDSALHHSLHQHLNPYFQTAHMAIGASPAESPLGGPSALGSRRAMNPQGTGSAMGGALSPLAAIRG